MKEYSCDVCGSLLVGPELSAKEPAFGLSGREGWNLVNFDLCKPCFRALCRAAEALKERKRVS